MTHISKNKLPSKEFNSLYNQMTDLVASFNKESTSEFFSELLGEEERVMLVKRLAAVVMYIEGNSSYRVWQLLQLSPSTAEKIRLDYERGRYKKLTNIIKRQRNRYHDFWRTLEIILQAKLPPRGRGRWKSALSSLKH